jgi:hypothetical protein
MIGDKRKESLMTPKVVSFAHAYEPHTFALDFYLPDFDLYIEVTVMKQGFPVPNLKLFGKRDVERLFGKYEALRPSA